MAMLLDEMYSMLSDGSRIRVAEDGKMYPNFEIWFVSNDVELKTTMLNSNELETDTRRNTEQRRAMIKRWAEYVQTHDDDEWSRQQNRLINSQLQAANDTASAGDTNPVRFAAARDRLRDR